MVLFPLVRADLKYIRSVLTFRVVSCLTLTQLMHVFWLCCRMVLLSLKLDLKLLYWMVSLKLRR